MAERERTPFLMRAGVRMRVQGCLTRRPASRMRAGVRNAPGSFPVPAGRNYMPFLTSGPLGHWQMGMISTRLMLMCAGRCVTQNTVSAMSCGVMGLVPS